MSFNGFLNEPKAYLATHEMYVANGPASDQAMTRTAPVTLPCGLKAIQWTQRTAGPFLTMHVAANPPPPGPKEKAMMALRKVGVVSRKIIQYTVTTVGGDIGFRYLPWNDNHMMYMQIDPAATFAITGPLTGCTPAVARDGAGALWFFHSNDNVNKGLAARTRQWHGIAEVCATLHIAQTAVSDCRYQRDYFGFGFAFGHRRQGGAWKFYAHGTDPNGHTRTVKWAEL